MAKAWQLMRVLFQCGLVIMALLILGGLPAVRAEPVLDRIERTGVFNAGTRMDTLPFGYRNKKGQLAGFSVDLLGEIHRRLEQRFGRPLKQQLHEVTPVNRIELVSNATIDIECGVTTPTWTREAQVDFSIPFFGNGTRIMTLQKTATQLQDLKGKHIGVAAGTTTAAILAEHVPEAIPVEVPDMATGFAQFSQGKLDGLANIGIVLRAMVEGSPLKSKVILLPRSGMFSYETMACILPQNDSAWRDFVNQTLAELLAGVDEYRGAYMEIYERWFGPRGVVYFPLDYATAQRLAASVIWLR
ncbi:MAG TPA: amino acid ABC transporter substrate-binding protein [Candidatus Competibacteraceae bacterium]|nr:amino acid ABC transporter substrate-binding protein [Candidatus Competibacteraceae bacterium]HRZ06824.1 amino acid ABC transporter substrate-binding protein [Candidatus Competibacteraceae bacterium]HSA47446.1 amino acid ABC transporter substrate-binding protein [Candidatus Competibacteraceae bacterium]